MEKMEIEAAWIIEFYIVIMQDLLCEL